MRSKIKGWYYDRQLESPLTSATLHANMWWSEKDKKFINWDQVKNNSSYDYTFGDNPGKCDTDYYKSILGLAKNTCGYGIDPICTSILNEDFNIAISNTWSEFGGDPIGETWNNLRGPMSGAVKPLIEAMETLFKKNKEVREANDNGDAAFGKVSGWISDAANWLSGQYDKIKNKDVDVVSFLNKALITNGTRFSYYGGTGVNFGNLGMKFTVFPKWDKNGKLIEVPTQVEKLYPYFIGQLESFKDATNMKDDNSNSVSYKEGVKEALNTCFMFQKPPGGYLTEMSGIDLIQQGTLKLKLGGFYEIANLVCSDIMISYSKNMVKNPENQELSPLFCDISITLRPSTKYSDIMLRKFVGGSTSLRNTMTNTVKNHLEIEETKILDNLL